MTDTKACFRRAPDGVDLFVRLTPKSSRDAVEGVEVAADGRAHLKARVRAVPENGKANQALIKLLAKALGTPGGRIRVISGETSRLKTLRVEGDPAGIEARIAVLVAADV